MKKYIFLFFYLLVVLSLNAQDVNPFKFQNLETPSNFNSGATLYGINLFFDYINVNKIKSVNIKRKIGAQNYTYEQVFENGFLKKYKESSNRSDKYERNYTYDEKGNLLTDGKDISYKYLSYDCRELYNGNYGLQSRQFIFFANDYCNILIEDVISNSKKEMQPYKDIKYFFSDNKIQRVVSDFYSHNKIYATQYYDFTYINELLEKLIIGYAPDDTRDIYKTKYNNKNQITEVEHQNIFRPEENSITYYSDYDAQGNWQFSKRYNGKNLIETVVRKFEYTD